MTTKSPRQTPTKCDYLLKGTSVLTANILFGTNSLRIITGFFYPPKDPDDYRFDMGNEHKLVEDVDAQTLMKLVKYLKRGKSPGPDTIHDKVLRPGTTTSLFHHLAKLFTSSIKLGYISTASKIAMCVAEA